MTKKETKLEEIQEEQLKIADKTNFSELYVVKGLRGIQLPRGTPNKSNLINMLDWSTLLTNRTNKFVNWSFCTCLNDLRFYTTNKKTIQVPKLDKDGKFITIPNVDGEGTKFDTKDKEIDVILGIKDVFNNFNEYENTLQDALTVEDFDLSNAETVKSLMDIAVPNFDEEKFKDYHLKKVIKYYTWFKEALNEFINVEKKEKNV